MSLFDALLLLLVAVGEIAIIAIFASTMNKLIAHMRNKER